MDYIICKPVALPQTGDLQLPAICIGTPELGLRHTDTKFGYECTVYYHLHLVSDKVVKKEKEGVLMYHIHEGVHPYQIGCDGSPCVKIEATTDKSLGLPLIPQSFIEEYVQKQGKIDKVKVCKTPNCKYSEGYFGEVMILPMEERMYNREELRNEQIAAINWYRNWVYPERPFSLDPRAKEFNEWFNKSYPI